MFIQRMTPFVLILAFVCRAQDTRIHLKFSEVEPYLLTGSPRIKVIKDTYKLAVQDSKLDLSWTNPELGYESEELAGNGQEERELTVTVRKSFELPWISYLRHKHWTAMNRSAEFRQMDQIRQVIAGAKRDYVVLKLLESQAHLLERINALLQTISGTAQDQYEEGAISGLEKNLIQMTLLNLDATMFELNASRRQLGTEWKTMLGIRKTSEVVLNSDVPLVIMPIDSLPSIDQIVEMHPGVLSAGSRETAFGERVKLEKWRILPEISLMGGYKAVNSDRDGYISGISLSVPLFNQNGARKKAEELNLRKFTHEYQLQKTMLEEDIRNAFSRLSEIAGILKKMETVKLHERDQLEQIISSYHEGWLSLSDMLSSVEIYFSHIQSHHQLLISYYESVFYLEAQTGKTLITF